MGRSRWLGALVFGLVVLLVFCVGIALLPVLFGGSGGYGPGYFGGGWGPGGMMGGWYPGGMMGGPGFGLGLFRLLTMAAMVGLPVLFLVLLALGIVWLVKYFSAPQAPGATAAVQPSATCKSCQKPVQADWQVCPYCGNKLG
ncbi:MAG: hypothetical protein HY871_00055 [Chloroflexi bacterium]|nr:hypothetical protein [Chloroflexota bacterium]